MIVIIDNYDSFTYNIYQAITHITSEPVTVLRSKECTIADVEKLNPSHLILSPGPGRPENAGITVEAIKHFAGKLPILGVCLGHQAICYAFGAKIVQAKFIKHGIAEEMSLDGRGLFRHIGKRGTFMRYHSLVVDESTLPPELEITARADDGDVMGVRHKTLDIEGVQFHPESIAAKDGEIFFRSFLNYRRDSLPVSAFLNKIIAKQDLSREEAELFMETLTEGMLDERQTAAILTALAAKGAAASEIAGCAGVLCKKKTPFPFDKNIDVAEIVGTGGDSKGSFNISSFSALICASCGCPVAKHGNRAVSSKSGAADFFENLGMRLALKPSEAAEVLKKTNFVFLFAQVYHSAMRFAGPVRKALGIKTIMNLIGPLTNPAEAKYLMLGAYSKDLLKPMAEAAKMLGAKHVLAISSSDGFDEISPSVPTYAYEIDEKNQVLEFVIDPKNFGIPAVNDDELRGGTGAENAAMALELANGKGRAAIRYAVGLNAGATLFVARKAASLEEGYKMALNALDSGLVAKKIEEIRQLAK
ncbi:MAG: bifunctional anthranilate synthase component II/anthranilate phosphoribosyltransferase [Hallerella porci]|uniref:bifunctional anthranilate synthase component II/anthranilate phosphoribosyltransferase n=1 Tax=Hallerella porci TaxID=1945871 RepID=UPI000D05C1A5|nr:bifunctional anthranilate synthase component II/anthranilate phosphoribosyltransferase [Hallerella porci]MDY3922159.1 bifunctional anthranilate synthase component II/anthranilate phosphoribosyltransferase [Hallerella porci]